MVRVDSNPTKYLGRRPLMLFFFLLSLMTACVQESTTPSNTDNTSSDSSGDTSTSGTITDNGAVSAIDGTSLPIRVNAGGPDYVDTQGNMWVADTGFNTGLAHVITSAIGNTENDVLFQSEHYDPQDATELRYSFPVQNGDYVVNLYFADRFQVVGQRVFSVQLENLSVLSDFDIYGEAGQNNAVRKSFTVAVADGNLDIDFTHVVENPKICAIEILPAALASSGGLDVAAIEQNAGVGNSGGSGVALPTDPGATTGGSTPPTAGSGTPGGTGNTGSTGSTTPVNNGDLAGAELKTVAFVGSNDQILNPERGFHSNVDLLKERSFTTYVNRGHTLVRSYIRIDNYRDSPLPASVISDLEAGLEALRSSAGVKAILRFSYNFGVAPDASKSVILGHLQQLAPTFKKYQDVIYIVQAGFIGAWGEWHSSTNKLDNLVEGKDVMDAILAAVPASRMVQVRYPRFKLGWYSKVDASVGFNGSARARIGHHNDCFLLNPIDGGTYNNKVGYPNMSVAEWKQYIADEGLFVPVGGEACDINNSRNDQGVVEMEQQHWVMANGMGDPNVVAHWKATGDYDVMQRYLGYRYRLIDADLPTSVQPGGNFNLRVALHNDGWSKLFNERPVFVVLDNGVNRYQVQLKDVDPRRWNSGADASFSARLELPYNMPVGDYKLSLWLPDAAANLQTKSAFSVRFANNGTWNAANGYNTLGVVGVYNGATGTVNTAATNFSVVN